MNKPQKKEEKKEEYTCPCCGEKSNEYGGGCKNGCYAGCSDIGYHHNNPCDKSC